MSSQPCIDAMSGTKVGAGTKGGNPGANQGAPTTGTPTSVVTPTSLLPFMAML